MRYLCFLICNQFQDQNLYLSPRGNWFCYIKRQQQQQHPTQEAHKIKNNNKIINDTYSTAHNGNV